MVRVEEMLSRGDTSTCSQILRHEPLVVGRVFEDFPPRSAHNCGYGQAVFFMLFGPPPKSSFEREEVTS